jgi:hypothetical protein
MLTDMQRRVLEKAGVEVVALRLAAMSNAEPDARVIGFLCAPPIKRDLEDWLKSKLRRQWAIHLCEVTMAAVPLAIIVALGVWGVLHGPTGIYR